ncbi:Protein of unknown function [Gryllus bimaculatus]|nr:Protein of unknown function [Gryllus bimaculatus]
MKGILNTAYKNVILYYPKIAEYEGSVEQEARRKKMFKINLERSVVECNLGNPVTTEESGNERRPGREKMLPFAGKCSAYTTWQLCALQVVWSSSALASGSRDIAVC